MPLLHDHLVVSVKVLRAEGKWGHLDSRTLCACGGGRGALQPAGAVCERLGLATVPRTPTPGLRPMMQIPGVPAELIAWYSTLRGRPRLRADRRARSRLMQQAADDTRRRKRTPLALTELRRRWRADAISRFGAAVIDGLVALCCRAATAIRAAWITTVAPGSSGAVTVVDVDLAAVDVAAVVYILLAPQGREQPRRRGEQPGSALFAKNCSGNSPAGAGSRACRHAVHPCCREQVVDELDRTRGAAPVSVWTAPARPPCAPHPPGCSLPVADVDPDMVLLPAPAGLFPPRRCSTWSSTAAPRTRGDELATLNATKGKSKPFPAPAVMTPGSRPCLAPPDPSSPRLRDEPQIARSACRLNAGRAHGCRAGPCGRLLAGSDR